jgi:hypothetical protein
MTNKGSLCKGIKINTGIKYEDVTRLIYGYYHPENEILLGSLINLEFLCIYSEINLSEINFSLFPNLKTLCLSFNHLSSDNLHNLTTSIETLYFNIYDVENYVLDCAVFLFDNLPTNLVKIIFECGRPTHKTYIKRQQLILNKIKKYKIPFNCKIYFITGNIDFYVEKSIFDE